MGRLDFKIDMCWLALFFFITYTYHVPRDKVNGSFVPLEQEIFVQFLFGITMHFKVI